MVSRPTFRLSVARRVLARARVAWVNLPPLKEPSRNQDTCNSSRFGFRFVVADFLNPLQRSLRMSTIKGKANKATELRLLALFRQHRIVGWRRHSSLPGRPDFAFHRVKLVVFVDGCFWHGCPKHGRAPETNVDYWERKLSRNRRRDKYVSAKLRAKGWVVIRVWEHSLKHEKHIARILRIVREFTTARSTVKTK